MYRRRSGALEVSASEQVLCTVTPRAEQYSNDLGESVSARRGKPTCYGPLPERADGLSVAVIHVRFRTGSQSVAEPAVLATD